jgi:hypothetical protein
MRSDAPSTEPSLRRWWNVITALLAIAVFMEAVFAGAMLSGVDWARAAHSMNAVILIASALAAGVVSLITLRRIPHGTKFGLTLLSLAALVALQMAAGKLTAEGANLLWVHVPLGAALVGFAMLAVFRARRLGRQ